MNQPLAIIILAAGKGTRMKSQKAKVLHEVFYAPMVKHVLKATEELQSEKTVVVVGHQKEKVEAELAQFGVTFAEQKEQLGTGHAVLSAEKALDDFTGTVMILCGDTPLIQPEMLERLFHYHKSTQSTVTLLTTLLDDPTNYGRIMSDKNGNITGIVEHKDANKEQLLIQVVNAGIYCVEKDFLFSTLKNVGTNNSQGEVYLTDIVHLAVEKELTIKNFSATDSIDVLGVNSRLELSMAQSVLQQRITENFMTAGVSMINPESIRISPDSTIDADVTIEPNVHICLNTSVAGGAVIEQGAVLKNCKVKEDAKIGAYSYLVNTTIEAGSTILPHTVKL